MHIIYNISFVHAHVQHCNTAHNNFVIHSKCAWSKYAHSCILDECAERENYDHYYNVVYSAHVHTLSHVDSPAE